MSDGASFNVWYKSNQSDSDLDGLSDGLEVNTHLTNPTLLDSDGDGLSDQEEIDGGSDPNNSNDPNQEPFRVELINMSSNSVIINDIPSEYIVDLNVAA